MKSVQMVQQFASDAVWDRRINMHNNNNNLLEFD